MGSLAIIDIQERDGHARQRHEVKHWPISIGRGLDNDIVLDDPHVAERHVLLSEEGGQVRFKVGDTRNGVRIDGHEFAAGGSGFWTGRHDLQLGRTIMKLRTVHDPVPEELPFLLTRSSAGLMAPVLLGIAYYIMMSFDRWLDFSGDSSLWRMLAPMLIGFTFILAFWVVGWSLVSKLFTKQLQLGRHLRVVLLGLVLLFVADEAVKVSAFSFNLPWLDTHASLVFFMGIGAIVFAHVRAMSSQRLPILVVAVSALVLAGYAAYMLAQYGRIGHASDKHYLTSLYPPALRVDKGTSVNRFIDQAELLKAQLDKEAGDPAEEDREYPE